MSRGFAPLFGLLLGAVALVVASCAVTTALPERRCVTTSDCSDGQTCRDGLCRGVASSDGGGVDGTVPDTDSGTTLPGDDAGTTIPLGEEICGNGRDDDGNGEVDEQCSCLPGISQDCYGGPAAGAGLGVCTIGSQDCVGSGEFGDWGPCTGWVGPTEDVCDGIDNDCDGTADEGCFCTTGEMRSCYSGAPGTEGVGLCMAGNQLCTDGVWSACMGAVLPRTEDCNGVDDDCDGMLDEGCTCSSGMTRTCYETFTGTPGLGAPGLGMCREGVASCVVLPGGGAGFGSCGGAITGTPEICDNGIDEDCDGMIDEMCGTPTVDCTIADVLLLVDTTGSMAQEIAQIKARLMDTIVPGLATEIADVRFAVARFDDFPVGGYGSGGDVPFALLQSITPSVAAAQAAVNLLGASGGGDGPESQVEGLYQSATGAGISPWVSAASCGGTGNGYPCFRPGATPIILLFTDANFHNGPGGSASYSGVGGARTYAQAVSALTAINARVLGLMSGASARADLERIATDTGAVAADGTPIVFDIGTNGASLGPDVVSAVRALCR